MSKHTPGPWAFGREGGMLPCVTGGGGIIHQSARTRGIQDEATIEANARLIAAAPELLAALKALVEMYGPSSEYSFEAKAAWEVGEAAIAKAGGRWDLACVEPTRQAREFNRLFDRIVEAAAIARMTGSFNEAVFKLGLTVILREEAVPVVNKETGEQMTVMPVIEVETTNDNDKDDSLLEVTMRGKPEALIHALVSGFNHDSLVAIKNALETEMAKRVAARS